MATNINLGLLVNSFNPDKDLLKEDLSIQGQADRMLMMRIPRVFRVLENMEKKLTEADLASLSDRELKILRDKLVIYVKKRAPGNPGANAMLEKVMKKMDRLFVSKLPLQNGTKKKSVHFPEEIATIKAHLPNSRVGGELKQLRYIIISFDPAEHRFALVKRMISKRVPEKDFVIEKLVLDPEQVGVLPHEKEVITEPSEVIDYIFDFVSADSVPHLSREEVTILKEKLTRYLSIHASADPDIQGVIELVNESIDAFWEQNVQQE